MNPNFGRSRGFAIGSFPVAPTLPDMSSFTLLHVAISLGAIASGFVVVFGLVASKTCPRMTAVFLWMTLATTVTGFMFPFHGVTPAFVTGIVSLVVLAPVFYAWYGTRLTGPWRAIHVIGAILSLYLNFFVLIVQSFLKISALHDLAPTQKEPPFAVAQGLAFVLFLVLGTLATLKFRPAPAALTG